MALTQLVPLCQLTQKWRRNSPSHVNTTKGSWWMVQILSTDDADKNPVIALRGGPVKSHCKA